MPPTPIKELESSGLPLSPEGGSLWFLRDANQGCKRAKRPITIRKAPSNLPIVARAIVRPKKRVSKVRRPICRFWLWWASMGKSSRQLPRIRAMLAMLEPITEPRVSAEGAFSIRAATFVASSGKLVPAAMRVTAITVVGIARLVARRTQWRTSSSAPSHRPRAESMRRIEATGKVSIQTYHTDFTFFSLRR